ncbi:MAG: hypothetical protein J6Q92_08115 [Oscillospiraceae bacterium]|nr:hypothetical protein [Oscillospiraceae bacterium]
MSGHRAAELLLFYAAYIAAAEEEVGFCRPIFLPRNDTHDGVDKALRSPTTDRFLHAAACQCGTKHLDNTQSIVCDVVACLDKRQRVKTARHFSDWIF